MSTVFPKDSFQANEPMDKDEINKNFETVVDEIQGSLGEHNWAENAITAIGSVDPTAIIRMYYKSQTVDHGISGPYTNPSSVTPTKGVAKISNNREWETILDMETAITTSNSVLWVLFSCQARGISTAGLLTELPGFQITIAVDGANVAEVVTGSMDRANDFTGEGMRPKSQGYSIDAVIPVAPGYRSITARARMVANKSFTNFNSSTDYYAVYNRELVIIEMR